MRLVAVYGTLKQGHGNHRLLSQSQFMGHETLYGWEMHSLGFCPAIVYSTPDSKVWTEVYKVDEDTFRRLDMLEGYPSFYNRKLVTTQYGEAWVYFFDSARDISNFGEDSIVENGVW